MRETSISFVVKDDYVTFHTSDKGTAKSIKGRLEHRGADWEWAKYQNGKGSWKFKVSKADCRAPNRIIKNPPPDTG